VGWSTAVPLSWTASGSLVASPAQAVPNVYLDSIACLSVGLCVAGSFGNGGQVVTFAAPAFTSAPAAAFIAGEPGSFTVTTSGFPVPSLLETGPLPAGLSFVDNGDGTATLTGTASTGTGGTYSLTLTATSGLLPAAVQPFTLTVDEAPLFTVDTPPLTATSGDLYAYHFAASGTPAPTYALTAAPSWLTINASTGTVSGRVPRRATSFSYAVTASNSVGHATAGPFPVKVHAAVQNVFVRYSGAVRYANGRAVTSGSINVGPYSVVGWVTIPGLHGGAATITVDIFRHFRFYAGDISVRDPSVNFRVVTPVFTRHLTRGPDGSVMGEASGLARGRPYHLWFSL
jgi:hypothetical protein